MVERRMIRFLGTLIVLGLLAAACLAWWFFTHVVGIGFRVLPDAQPASVRQTDTGS